MAAAHAIGLVVTTQAAPLNLKSRIGRPILAMPLAAVQEEHLRRCALREHALLSNMQQLDEHPRPLVRRPGQAVMDAVLGGRSLALVVSFGSVRPL